MDVEGEIQHAGPCGQDAELPRRGEHEDLPRRRFREVFRRRGALVLEVVAHAGEPSVEGLGPLDALVGPVGGQSALGHLVHALRADLHFDGVPGAVPHRDVQGFVAVGLGLGKPVAKAGRVRLVFFRDV